MSEADMTTSALVALKFGGCAVYRVMTTKAPRTLYGAWAKSDPSVWMETQSSSEEELRAKLLAMEPRTVAFAPDLRWTEYQRDPAKAAASQSRGGHAGTASAARRRASLRVIRGGKS